MREFVFVLLFLLLGTIDSQTPSPAVSPTVPATSPGTSPLSSPIPSPVTNSTGNSTSNSTDSGPPLICSDKGELTWGVGSPFVVCLRVFANGVEKVAMFYPNLDDYSLLEVNFTEPKPGGFPFDLSRADNAPVLYVEAAGRISGPKVLSNLDASLIVIAANIVVQVNDGVVARIFWDQNKCTQSGCGPTSKQPDICVEASDQCGVKVAEYCTDPTVCTVRAYISFAGTDKYLVPLKSAAVRLSNWRQFTFAAASGLKLGKLRNRGQASPLVSPGTSPLTSPAVSPSVNSTSPVPTAATSPTGLPATSPTPVVMKALEEEKDEFSYDYDDQSNEENWVDDDDLVFDRWEERLKSPLYDPLRVLTSKGNGYIVRPFKVPDHILSRNKYDILERESPWGRVRDFTLSLWEKITNSFNNP